MIIYLKKYMQLLFKKVIPLLYFFFIYGSISFLYLKQCHLKYLALFVLEDNEIENFLNY